MDFVILLMGNPPLGESEGIMFTSLFAYFLGHLEQYQENQQSGGASGVEVEWLRLVSWIACVEETMGRLKIST